MLKLVRSNGATYEEKYTLDDETEDKWPVFELRKLSSEQVNAIDDQNARADKSAQMRFLTGTTRRLKIDAAVVSWKNVCDEDGTDVACTSKNKEALPAKVQAWLEEHINEKNGLDKTSVGEADRKNS